MPPAFQGEQARGAEWRINKSRNASMGARASRIWATKLNREPENSQVGSGQKLRSLEKGSRTPET